MDCMGFLLRDTVLFFFSFSSPWGSAPTSFSQAGTAPRAPLWDGRGQSCWAAGSCRPVLAATIVGNKELLGKACIARACWDNRWKGLLATWPLRMLAGLESSWPDQPRAPTARERGAYISCPMGYPTDTGAKGESEESAREGIIPGPGAERHRRWAGWGRFKELANVPDKRKNLYLSLCVQSTTSAQSQRPG